MGAVVFFSLDYAFVFSMLASALEVTFSAVKPKWGKSLPAGADAPNVSIQTVSPQSPVYLYQL